MKTINLKGVRKLLMLLLLFIGFNCYSQIYIQDESWMVNNAQSEYMVNKKGYAIDGFDVVAYFEMGEAKKGIEKYAYEWKNAKWLFSSKKHLKLFKQNPMKYAPQYGGWCAYGMSGHGYAGYPAQTKPKNSWTIYNNKLYLNFNPNVVKAWNKDKDNYIENADYYWEELKEKIKSKKVKAHWQENQ